MAKKRIGVCSKCKGEDIQLFKAGASVGKGVVGSALLGPIGIAASAIGKYKIECVCKTCR